MYACGVYRKGIAANYMGGVYLWAGNQNGGWGSNGEGAFTNDEEWGHKRGRWFCALPFGVVAIDAPTARAAYGGRLYLTGGYSHNLVLDEHHRLWKQGIRPPEEIPDFAAGGGSGTLTAYFSWYDEFTGERSPLSLGQLVNIPLGSARTWQNLPERPPDDVYLSDDSVTLDGIEGGFGVGTWWIDETETQGGRLAMLRPGDEIDLLESATQRFSQCFMMNPLIFDNKNNWSGIGASTPSPVDVVPVTRATHLELWLQPAADFPRLALRVARGTTTVVESTDLGDLGEAFISSFQRMPRATLSAIYHDRQIIAGDPENPDTVYLSQLFYPERWDGLQFQTKSGEPVTGILATRDYCLVFTRNSTYMLQGYTDTDYSFQLIDQSLGSVGHNCNVVIHGNPFVWTEKGPYMYNGMFHPLSPENRWHPVSSGAITPQQPRGPAESMEATDDPFYNTYIVSNAWDAARNLGNPFDENEVLEDPGNFYHAVLDYTLVTPETGGAMRPARLNFDKGHLGSSSEAYLLQQLVYLRTRWGEGALYDVGHAELSLGTYNDPYGETAPTVLSFPIIAMQNYGTTGPANWPSSLIINTNGRIILPFYYFEDPGGYAFEAKKFVKLWVHAKFPERADYDKNNWWVRIYAGPDSNFWNRLKDKKWFQDGSGDDWEYVSPMLEISESAGTTGGDAPTNEDHVLGDILTPPLPTSLQGRGLWVDINMGDGRAWFAGFGGYYIPGAIVNPWLVVTPE
jgi:hypothetical protein